MITISIKPIETVYKGYRFRSRSEARWAVFFDELKIPYEYEPEGFSFSNGMKYLPDFYLPSMHMFFEVKGVMTEEDAEKITMFLKETSCPIAMGYADMTFESPHDSVDGYTIDNKNCSYFAKCMKCGQYYFVGESGSYKCHCCGYYDGNCTMDVLAIGNNPIISLDQNVLNAFAKARQARFEHGESPESVKKYSSLRELAERLKAKRDRIQGVGGS